MRLFLFLSIILPQAFALELSEDKLIQLSQEGNPEVLALEAELLNAQVQEAKLKDDYAWGLNSTATRSQTNERPLISFQPVFSPTSSLEIGVSKKLPYGLDLSATAGSEKLTFSDSSGAKTERFVSLIQTTLSFDLLKNLLGKTDRAELKNLKAYRKQAELQAEIERHRFTLKVRRKYWSLIAQDESFRLSRKLYKATQRQAKETQKRVRQSVADSGDLARSQAQVANRQTNLTLLEYQRTNIEQELKELIPSLINQEISLAPVNLNNVVTSILSCTQQISRQKETPLAATTVDEILTFLTLRYKTQEKIDETYDQPNLSLNTTFMTTGVDERFNNSVRDFQENNRYGSSLSLNFSMPLGKSKKNTHELIKALEKKRFFAQKNKIMGQVQASHESLKFNIQRLFSAVQTKKENTSLLEKRIKSAQQKYRQGRISLTDLINDQNALLASQLETVDIQLAIINTLFDYFEIFTLTPCQFNRTTT